MRYEEVIRAWKNPAFRATLAGAEMMFAHPSGLVELNDSDLDAVSGAGGSSCSGGGKKSGKSGKKSGRSHKKSSKSGKGGCRPC